MSSHRWHSHTGAHCTSRLSPLLARFSVLMPSRCETDQDGLRAPFIIHATDEAHKYDGDYTIILSDWYHARSDKLNHKVSLFAFAASRANWLIFRLLRTQFMNKYNPTGAEPVPGGLRVSTRLPQRSA